MKRALLIHVIATIAGFAGALCLMGILVGLVVLADAWLLVWIAFVFGDLGKTLLMLAVGGVVLLLAVALLGWISAFAM